MADWRVKRSPVGALAIVVLSLLLPACRAPGHRRPPGCAARYRFHQRDIAADFRWRTASYIFH